MDPLPPVDAVLAKLAKLGIPVPAGAVRVDAYGDSPGLSESLLALIRSGRKRAGTSLLWGIEAEGGEVPAPGQIELVVDHLNEPALVCRITEVRIVPFDEVTAEYAAIEGEGDGSLEYWREGHWAFFSRECRRIDREPDERMPVVCSVFELLSVVPEQTHRLKQ
ncbi:MAG: ASCH domain-containing protein [Lysobacter sp.]|nr:ASCH domain-containing protein [Lysobacter sp.]